MAKKKDASTGSADASGLRRSGRETSSRKQITPSPVNFKKSATIENHTAPTPLPVVDKPEKVEKQMGPTTTPLRRSDRGKKLIETPELPNIKSTEEKAANNSKKCLEDVNEDEETEEQDSDVGVRKRKRFTAIRYKALFKPQRIRIESDDEGNPNAKDKSPQAITNWKEDVDKELKNQNSIRVQEAPEKGYEVALEGRVIDLDQVEHGDCPRTKSLDGKSIESGDVDKQIGGNVSPSDRNIGNNDNHTSSDRNERDLEENQQQLDTCHKVTGACKAAVIMENAENNVAPSNMQNSKFVEFWVPVQISNVQLEQYCGTLLSNAMALRSSSKSDPLGAIKDVFLTNRKCCNHPYIVDLKLQESLIKGKEQSMILDIGIKASGKFHFLDRILPEIQKQKLKTLILFQRTGGTLSGSLSLGDILVDYVHKKFGQDSYEQLEGAGAVSSKKQAALNIFNTNPSKFIFLLESRACHQTIKVSADVIIIFDSDLNPSNDLKSLQKMSIDSQSEQIMIFRLYCSSTLEEMILKLAENNMAVEATRSHNIRSNYDTLLTWGASDLFDKLTKFHSQTALKISSEESLLEDVVEEFLYIISHKCKRNNTTSKGVITQVQNCVSHGKNNSLHSEVKTNIPNGDQPCVFWRKLLEGRFPSWKFVSESTPRQRKRPSYFLDNSGVDGGARTRRKTVNLSTIEPAQLKTVAQGEIGVNEGVPTANDESQSSSGDQFWSTATSLLDFLKPTVSELCNLLKFSEDVKVIVEKFLEFVLENYQVGKEHKSAIQAFMISLCWIGSTLGNNEIDRSESFALAKKHFKFCCMEEEANSVYNKLEPVKKPFLQSPQGLDCLKDSAPATEEAELEVNKSQHTPNVENHESHEHESGKDKEEAEVEVNKGQHIPNVENHESHENESEKDKEEAEVEVNKGQHIPNIENHESHENESGKDKEEAEVEVNKGQHIPNGENQESRENESGKGKEEFEKIKRDWDKERANIEHDYKLEKILIHQIYGSIPSIRSEKLKLWEREFANKLDKLEEEKRLAAEGQVAADHDFSLHSGNPEVGPTLPETQSHDEPVCEGANDIESTGSHTSERDVVDATASSEQVGSVPAQQVDEDMEVDVVGVDTITVEDNNETAANDMAPHVDSDDMEMPAGHCNKENDEDCTVGLDTSHVGDDCHETIDEVAPEVEVESDEMGTPAGTCDKESPEDGEIYPNKPDAGNVHNETSPNNVLPRVEFVEMGTSAGTCDSENAEDGEICADTPGAGDCHNETISNDVLPRLESAEIGTPAGTCDNENAADGEICPNKPVVGDGQNEPISNDVLPCLEFAEIGMPAGTCDKEDTEYGEINHDKPDDDDDLDETSLNDVLTHVETVEMGTPAGTCDEEHAEDGEVNPDKPDDDDNHDEASLNYVLQRVETVEMPMPAGTCDKENAEDGEIMLDTSDTGDGHEDGEIIPDASGAGDGNNETSPNDTLPQDTPPSDEPVTSPASDHLEPIIPEIQNEPLQLQQLPDSGFQDETNVGNLQRSGASQVDQVTLEVEQDFPLSTDPMVAENPSDPLPTSGPILEPMCEEPTLTVPQSGENLEANHVHAAETPQEEQHQAHVAPSVVPAPPVNGLNQFDNLSYQVNPLLPVPTDPLQAEVERLCTVKDNVVKYYQETKQKLESECDKEIAEVVAQIRLKYEAKHLESDIAYNSKKLELETNINRVIMNRILAGAFRSKCRDLNTSGHPEMQQAPSAELMQHLHRLGSPSMRRFHGSPSSSPGQSSRNQQPPQLPLQQPQPHPQLRPQLPPQIVHQPGALFSSRPPSITSPSTTPSRPPPVVNQITSSSTPPTITRLLPTMPPPIVNQTTPSTTPTTTRPRPTVDPITPSSTPTTSRPPPTRPPSIFSQIIHPTAPTTSIPRPTVDPITPSSTPTTTRPPPPTVNQITPSTTPTTSRPRPTVEPVTLSSTPTTSRLPPVTNPSVLPNKSPPSITQINMSAANLRISTETRRQSPHVRPVVSSEPRAPAPHMRPVVSSEPRAPAPHMRPVGSSEPRAPAPHLRPLVRNEPVNLAPRLRPLASSEARAPAPHLRSFRSTPSVSPDVGTHRQVLPSQHVTSGPFQPPALPPPSTSSLPPIARRHSEPFTVPSQPPPSEPCTVPPSAETPSVQSFDNLNGLKDNAPRWVDIPTSQHDARSQFDRRDITDLTREGTAQSSSAHDLVCLSDDD